MTLFFDDEESARIEAEEARIQAVGNAEFPDDTIWCVTQPFESGNMCEKYYRSKK